MKCKLIDALLVLAAAVIVLLAFWAMQTIESRADHGAEAAASEPVSSSEPEVVVLALPKLTAAPEPAPTSQLNRDYFPSDLPAGENIRYGMEYLGRLLAQYDTIEAALTAYNAGHDTGSRVYANAVLAAAEKWRRVDG